MIRTSVQVFFSYTKHVSLYNKIDNSLKKPFLFYFSRKIAIKEKMIKIAYFVLFLLKILIFIFYVLKFKIISSKLYPLTINPKSRLVNSMV